MADDKKTQDEAAAAKAAEELAAAEAKAEEERAAAEAARFEGICAECYPTGWPDGVTSTGCEHGAHSR